MALRQCCIRSRCLERVQIHTSSPFDWQMYCSEGSVSSQPFCHFPLWYETLYSSRASRTPVGAAVAMVAAVAKRKSLENCMLA